MGSQAAVATTERPRMGHSGWLWSRWLLTRLMVVGVLLAFSRSAIGDVDYYAANVARLLDDGTPDQALREYPLPVLSFLLPPWLLGGENQQGYRIVFAALMLLADATFTALVWTKCGRRPAPAVRLWVYAMPLFGPLLITRFDVVPGILVGAALLVLASRPGWAGALTAAGVAVKLWPVLIAPALAAYRSGAARVIGGFGAAGLLLVSVTVAVAGFGRLLSPLRYQTDRGLQIESIAATPLMVGWMFDPDRWEVALGPFLAWEISGPGEESLLALTTVATVAAGLVMATLWLRALRLRDALTPVTVGWVAMASVLLFLITNKVLSPQYLLWVLPLAVALLVISPRDPLVRRLALLLVVAGGLTQLIFPTMYGWLIDFSAKTPVGVEVLAARNALLLLLAWLAVRQAWSATALTAEGPAEAPSKEASGSWRTWEARLEALLLDGRGNGEPASP